MVLVPRDAPGVKVERLLTTMGYYDEPLGHGEVVLHRRPGARWRTSSPARARRFAIAQGRLGPGRVHHCMRADRAGRAGARAGHASAASSRTAFGKPLVNLGGNRERIADARIAIDQARLLVLNAAWKLDAGRTAERAVARSARSRSPCRNMAQRGHRHGHPDPRRRRACPTTSRSRRPVADARALRLADGPDEVHRGVVARLELGKYAA